MPADDQGPHSNVAVETPCNLSPDFRSRKNASRYVIKVEWTSKQTARVLFTSSQTASTPSTLLVSGRGYITCLRGTVEVHGFVLSADPNGTSQPQRRIPFDCPSSWSNWLTIGHNSFSDAELDTCLQIDSMRLELSEEKQENSSPSSRQVKQKSESSASFDIQLLDIGINHKSIRPTIFPDAWEQVATEILFDQARYARTDSKDIGQSIRSPDVINEIRTGTKQRTSTSFVVAICGAKGVGKSTFLRYLLNQFLSRIQDVTVGVLDADLGQPELSPPGLVSLTIPITEPLLSSPHMHMVVNSADKNHPFCSWGNALKSEDHFFHKNQTAFFLASTSSANTDTTSYMQSIDKLMHDFRMSSWMDAKSPDHNSPPAVLLVNLDGWVKGLGRELLQALLQQTIRPTHIVQIQGTTPSQQFELDRSSLVADDGNSTCIHVIPSYRSHYVHMKDREEQTPPVAGPINFSGSEFPEEDIRSTSQRIYAPVVLPSTTMRTLRLCTYFLDNDISLWERLSINLRSGGTGISDPEFEISKRLAAMSPYEVPLQSMMLLDPVVGIDSDCTELYSWNATIVGLCYEKTKENQTPWHLLPCVGLGIVRSIDVIKGLFYILTPVDPHALTKVNVLVKSQTMGLPLEMTYRGVHSECFPYMEMKSTPDEDMILLGTAPIKSRNTIGRRKFRPND